MASASVSIPRFLLPQSGLIWRRVAAGTPAAAPSTSVSASASRRVFLRLASNQPGGRFTRPSQNTTPSQDTSSAEPPSGQRVLEKPERFNPPSHGSRLPRKNLPRHYGGELSADEFQTQLRTEYPGMMAPKGTRAYWFWHSRWIHVVITVGTLSGLAIWTFALSFKHTSPFADMLPSASDFLWHPLASTRQLIEVLRLHEAHKSARIAEKRKRNVEDVAKRAAYRKAHGLPDEMGLFNQPMAKINMDGEGEEKGVDDASPVNEAAVERGGEGEKEEGVRHLTEEEKKEVVKDVKGKWLGIF